MNTVDQSLIMPRDTFIFTRIFLALSYVFLSFSGLYMTLRSPLGRFSKITSATDFDGYGLEGFLVRLPVTSVEGSISINLSLRSYNEDSLVKLYDLLG